MDETDMEKLLGFYKPNGVPSLAQLKRSEHEPVVGFGGAFGWW